jgi:hypothetical protein
MANDMSRLRPAVAVAAVLLASVLVPGSARAAKAPGFHSTVTTVTAASLDRSYHPGCPVGPADLRALHVSYWGFDGHVRQGIVVVNRSVVATVRSVFAMLYAKRFPIRRMTPVSAYGGSDDRSLAADNTAAFNCRYAVTTGPKQWSVHAFGEAIDVDPLENPYLLGSRVYPPAGRRFLDRSNVRPGMAVPGGTLLAAFATVGWQWGGRWTGSPDYQHFSATGG